MTGKNDNKSALSEVSTVANKTLDEVEKIVDPIGEEIEKAAAPIRKSVLKRFPILFLLAVTFGFTATITGIEQILLRYDILQNYPWILFIMGIGTLVLTGTLYKKLG